METFIKFRGKDWRVEIQCYESNKQPAISLIDPDDETALTATINMNRDDGLVYIQDWHHARTQISTNDPTYNIIKALQLGGIIGKFETSVFKSGVSVKPIQGFKLTDKYQKLYLKKI